MAHELFEPIHPNARPMNGLFTRICAALAMPYQTSYVAPELRRIDALLYALRGYDVYWTPVSFDEEDVARNPSSVCYRIFKRAHGERYHSHGVELRGVWPGWAHGAVCEARRRSFHLRHRIGLTPTPQAGTKGGAST